MLLSSLQRHNTLNKYQEFTWLTLESYVDFRAELNWYFFVFTTNTVTS